jgi:hypothetical protein
MMIPEHSVDQVLEAAHRMDRQRREHDERYAKDS